MRVVIAFLAGSVVTYLLSVLGYTQLILANVVEMGLPVPFDVRLSATGHDLLSMLPIFLPLIMVGLGIGLGIARLISGFVPHLRDVGYVLAGAVAMWAIEAGLGLLIGTHPLATTRTAVGLIALCASGAIGGAVFVRVLGPRKAQVVEEATAS